MSSPYPTARDGLPERALASSPVPGSGGSTSNETLPQGVSLRPMRLKVLYTFDDQNKTNCLARWPQVLNIRTAFMDDTAEIGVIELKTCIQAIVAASPELVAKLGQDYTVYAYDYSEYETPLVGQGMLSWVLASASSTPSAPAHQSRTVVTGRVCNNILGLFSNGVQETLEVKLRLVPVPTCLQSEYISSMQKYRELSKVMPQGFDASAWTAFLQANPAIMQLAGNSRCQSPMAGLSQRDGSGLELVHQMLSEGGMTQDSDEQHEGRSGDVNQHVDCSQGSFTVPFSRTGSPAANARPSAGLRQLSQSGHSRPALSASQRGYSNHQRSMSNSSRRPSADVGYASNDDGSGGLSRKRAKVTRVEWPARSSLGNQAESLRVAASSAASVRVYQPKPIRPPVGGPGSMEEPPRAPTPVPNPGTQMQRRTVAPRQSSLRSEAYDHANSDQYRSPYDPMQGHKTVETNMTSPEDSQTGSISNTPPDIASSPPVMRAISPGPSSPALPTLQRNVDSGFMSGPIEGQCDEEDEDMRSIDGEDLEIASQYSKRTDVTTQIRSQAIEPYSYPPHLSTNKGLPRTFVKKGRATRSTSIVSNDAAVSQNNQSLPAPRPGHQAKVMPLPRVAKAQARGKTAQPTPPSACAMDHASSAVSGPLPPVPVSDPIRPHPNSLQRSHTWSGQQMQHPASDAPTSTSYVDPTSADGASIVRRSGSGAKRKKAIQERLATSIATGEMPPYCENCGAIETPTWRKAWVRIHSGTPDLVQISDEEGGIIAWEALERDQQGTITLFRIIKRSLLDLDAGFTEILLCNPCGLWLNKSKCMRPKEKWNKERRVSNHRPKRPYKPRKSKADSAAEAQSTNNEGQASTMTPDESSPAGAAEETMDEDNEQWQQVPSQNRPRAASMQPETTNRAGDSISNATATAALQRAIQSSPARFMGTQHSPIEVDDLTPKPTRRLLFPSPKAAGEPKALQDRSPNAGGRTIQSKQEHTITDQADNKENCPPEEEGDELAHLFEDNDNLPNPNDRPTTPTPTTSKHHTDPFKTPEKPPTTPTRKAHHLSPADIFSSAAKALLLPPPITPKHTSGEKGPRTPMGELTPFTAHLNRLLSEANASPSNHNHNSANDNFDFPSLPSLDGNTPQGHGLDFSNFDPQDLLSTDVPMPSSPPQAFFALYEDPVEPGSGLWSDYRLDTGEVRLEHGNENENENEYGQKQRREGDDIVVVGVVARDEGNGNGNGNGHGTGHGEMEKTNIAAGAVDFSALIEDVGCDGS